MNEEGCEWWWWWYTDDDWCAFVCCFWSCTRDEKKAINEYKKKYIEMKKLKKIVIFRWYFTIKEREREKSLLFSKIYDDG